MDVGFLVHDRLLHKSLKYKETTCRTDETLLDLPRTGDSTRGVSVAHTAIQCADVHQLAAFSFRVVLVAVETFTSTLYSQYDCSYQLQFTYIYIYIYIFNFHKFTSAAIVESTVALNHLYVQIDKRHNLCRISRALGLMMSTLSVY